MTNKKSLKGALEHNSRLKMVVKYKKSANVSGNAPLTEDSDMPTGKRTRRRNAIKRRQWKKEQKKTPVMGADKKPRTSNQGGPATVKQRPLPWEIENGLRGTRGWGYR
jgi:hypothetical protein